MMIDTMNVDGYLAQIAGGTDRLAALFSDYEEQRAAITSDPSRTPDWKARALEDMHENTIEPVERAVSGIWGEIVYTDASQTTEGPDMAAPAWQALKAINQGLEQALREAEQQHFDPLLTDFYTKKLQAMLTRARDTVGVGGSVGSVFLEQYNQASADTRAAAQVLTGALVPAQDFHSKDWFRVRQQIERDRLAALETEQVQAWRGKRAELIDALERVYPLTIRAAEVFGRRSFLLPRIPRGIDRRAEYDPVSGGFSVEYNWRPSQTISYQNGAIRMIRGGGLFG